MPRPHLGLEYYMFQESSDGARLKIRDFVKLVYTALDFGIYNCSDCSSSKFNIFETFEFVQAPTRLLRWKGVVILLHITNEYSNCIMRTIL